MAASFTLAQLTALEEAIAQGSLRVSFSAAGTTKEVTYRSMSEMLIARNLMRSSLCLTGRNATTIRVSTSKGTDRGGRGSQFDEGESNEWENWPSQL
jgi:hypothetical protein